jgi:hypothetical protein
VDDRLLWILGPGLFESFDGQLDAAYPLVAPAECHPGIQVGRLGLAGSLERLDGFFVALGGSEGLAAEMLGLWPGGECLGEAIERVERVLGQPTADGLRGRPFLAEQSDQIEIALGLSKDLLSADSIGSCHVSRSLKWLRLSPRNSLFNSSHESRQANSNPFVFH